MKKLFFSLFLVCAVSLFGEVKNGDDAPPFTLKDVDGAEVSLSDFAGKTVVLEWVNPGCPFVRKFYTNKDMGKFQAKAAEMGVVWLSVNSTSNRHADYMEPPILKSWAQEHGHAGRLLMDSTGKVGKAYGARTTPHMFIINGKGKLVYQGAIDSVRDADPGSVSFATNYVMDALKAMAAGKEIPEDRTRPYGCAVKY